MMMTTIMLPCSFSPDFCGSFLEYTLICRESTDGKVFCLWLLFYSEHACITYFTNNIGNQLHPLNSFPPFPLTMNNEFFTEEHQAPPPKPKASFQLEKNNNNLLHSSCFTSVVGPKEQLISYSYLLVYLFIQGYLLEKNGFKVDSHSHNNKQHHIISPHLLYHRDKTEAYSG